MQFLTSSFLPAETRPSPGELLQTLQGSDLSSVRRTAMTFPCMELRCKDLELPKLTSIIGAKYLGFFSSRSLKMKEKYISFAKFVYFLREYLNDKIHNYVKEKHNCEFYHSKIEK